MAGLGKILILGKLPKNMQKLKARWSLYIKECDLYFEQMDEFSYGSMWHSWDFKKVILTTSEFETFKSLTILVNIDILDNNEDESDLQQDTATKQWMSYMDQNDHNVCVVLCFFFD